MWAQAVQRGSPTEGEPGVRGPGGGNEIDGDDEPIMADSEWTRVGAIVERASEVLMITSAPEALARLAKDWCAVKPEPVETRHGLVHLCQPDPPIEVNGHAFSLELGTTGVIGLVASDLTAQQSEQLSAQARDATAPWCLRPFEGGYDVDSGKTADLRTCPMRGGSTLVVGRLQPEDPDAPDASRDATSDAADRPRSPERRGTASAPQGRGPSSRRGTAAPEDRPGWQVSISILGASS